MSLTGLYYFARTSFRNIQQIVTGPVLPYSSRKSLLEAVVKAKHWGYFLVATLIVIVIPSAAPLLAQSPANMAPMSSKNEVIVETLPPISPRVIRWEQGRSGCDLKYLNGRAIKEVSTAKFWVGAMLLEEWGKTSAQVLIATTKENNRRVEVSYQSVSLFRVEGNRLIELDRKDPAKMARSAGRWAGFAAGMQSMGAGMQTQTATATSSDGAQTTVTIPNYEAQRQAQQNGAQAISSAQSAGQSMIERALKRNTLDRDQSVVGGVYFDRQKKGTVLVRVSVGDTVFELPFDAKTRE